MRSSHRTPGLSLPMSFRFPPIQHLLLSAMAYPENFRPVGKLPFGGIIPLVKYGSYANQDAAFHPPFIHGVNNLFSEGLPRTNIFDISLSASMDPAQQLAMVLSTLAHVLYRTMRTLIRGKHRVGILTPARALVEAIIKHFPVNTRDTEETHADYRDTPTLYDILLARLGLSTDPTLHDIVMCIAHQPAAIQPFVEASSIINATGKTMRDVIVFKPFESNFSSMQVQAVEAFSRNKVGLWLVAQVPKMTGAYAHITAILSVFAPLYQLRVGTDTFRVNQPSAL